MPRSFSPIFRLTLALTGLGLFSLPASAAILNVPAQYATIQAAIYASVSGDTVVIADGTYTGPGNVDLDFGGRNLTVTSQHGAAATTIDCQGSSSANHRAFNLHNGEANAVLSGLTIENGYENGDSGGGIYNSGLGLTVQGCIFRNNTAAYGGALYNSNYDSYQSGSSSTLNVTNCIFTGNTAEYSAGGVGNTNYTNGTSTITYCTFTGNTASGGSGGGLYNENFHGGLFVLSGCLLTSNVASSSLGTGGGLFTINGGTLLVTNCTLSGNTARQGGGMGNYNDDYGFQSTVVATLTNCTITGNSALNDSGGGIYNTNFDGAALTVINCTLTGNSAPILVGGGGIYNVDNSGGMTTLTNDILYGDTSGEILQYSPLITTYCDVQGGYAGTGNINADPRFVSGSVPYDLHLKPGSPCLGAGTPNGAPTTTLDGRTRPSPPSIGAYEAAATSAITTTTTLRTSLSPATVGQNVTFTATVAGAGKTPTGSVTFTVDGTAQSSMALSSGKAAYSTSALAGGSHLITAAYGGDASFAPSKSSALTQTVTTVHTMTGLTSSLNPAVYGQPVTFTAAVTGSSPTGTVTFTDTTSGYTLGAGTLSGGSATVTVYGLAAGSHKIVASYGGDGGNGASTSASLTQAVSKGPTTTTLTSSLNPSVSGQSVTFTVNMTGSGGILLGTVVFTIDGAAQAPIPLSNGYSAAYTATALAVGSHTVTASYSGDANFASSAASPLTQTVVAHVSPQNVSPLGSDTNPGTPALPKLTIQAAINATLSGDTVVIADGIYTGPGNGDLDFGGRNITVTSQHGAATTIIDCQGSSSANHRGFFLHSFETGAVLSGLTIENGYEANDTGGAIKIISVGLTVQDCVLKNNSATSGGGIAGSSYSYNSPQNTLVVTHCLLSGNMAQYSGGGIANSSSGGGVLTVTNSTLTGNTASYGGGIESDTHGTGLITVTNCAFTGNTAADGGSGFLSYTDDGGTTMVTNCTFTANSVVFSSDGSLNTYDNGPGRTTLTNDIFYGDTGGEIAGYPTTVSYCDVQGGYTGTGNIDADPLFVSGSAPYELHLKTGSSCLGAGTLSGAPATDADGTTRPSPPSIGAYEIAPLAPPTSLTATAGVGQVTLHWIAPAGVSGAKYSLYRGTVSGGETFYKSAGTATSFVNGIVTAGTKYFYTVRTVVGTQTSAASNEASATPAGPPVAPAAPTALKAAAGDAKVTLTWTAPAGTVTSYTVYRGTSASALTLSKSGITAKNFTDTAVANGVTYYYAVYAANSGGTSPASNTVSATPISVPAAPTSLTATASGGRVTLAWAAPSGPVTSYSVYRGTAPGGETFYKTAGAATSFVNALVTRGTQYFYTVRAVNNSGTGPSSNEASATP